MGSGAERHSPFYNIMKISKTYIVDVDIAKERKRLKMCFWRKNRKLYNKLSRLVDAFEENRWTEACNIIVEEIQDHRDEEWECSELEFINPTIYDILGEFARGENVKVMNEETKNESKRNRKRSTRD